MNDVAPAAYFLDTSALLPRFMRRAPGYAWINQICAPEQGNVLGLAEITEAEITSALYQLTRGGVLKAKRRDTWLDLFWDQMDDGEYSIIPITSATIRSAADLCRRHPLKGYDAVQLACALAFFADMRTVKSAPATMMFLSEDQRLLAAASAEGFAVDSPLAHMP